MAGNNIQGKVLNGDQLGFAKTGVPRGHPKRYHSGSVVQMTRNGKKILTSPEEEKIETEAERQLNELAKKQLETNVTIQEQLQRKRDFTGATVFKPLGAEVVGKMSLADYKTLAEQDKQIDELRHCGLSDAEIELKLAAQKYGTTDETHINIPDAKQAKLQLIEQKVAEKREALKQPTMFRGTREMTRHEQELEASISHDSEKSKLLSCLLTKKTSTEFIDPDHPMNHLDSIMQDVLHRSLSPRMESEFDKALQGDENRMQDELVGSEESHCCGKERLEQKESEHSNVQTSGCESRFECCEDCDRYEKISKKQGKPYSDWEAVSPKEVSPSDVPPASKSSKACDSSKGTLYTAEVPFVGPKLPSGNETSSENPRILRGDFEAIPEEHIIKYRLNIDQIRQLPRFQNYKPGVPSKTLYIKNLSPKVSEEELVSLFIRHQKPGSPPITFKLMSGRMKGQAFVTLDSEDTAAEAMKLLNGYQFKDRPMIIAYGRKNSSVKE